MRGRGGCQENVSFQTEELEGGRGVFSTGVKSESGVKPALILQTEIRSKVLTDTLCCRALSGLLPSM